MANKPLHKYTVAEASNLQVYESYKCEILTLSGTGVQQTNSDSDWDTPAKEILIFSASSVADDDGVTLNLKVNGSWGNNIVIAHDNLPFSVKGILMESVRLTGGSGDNDALTVLSFH